MKRIFLIIPLLVSISVQAMQLSDSDQLVLKQQWSKCIHSLPTKSDIEQKPFDFAKIDDHLYYELLQNKAVTPKIKSIMDTDFSPLVEIDYEKKLVTTHLSGERKNQKIQLTFDQFNTLKNKLFQ